eukprot:3004663-Amphidinium_carterae.1
MDIAQARYAGAWFSGCGLHCKVGAVPACNTFTPNVWQVAKVWAQVANVVVPRHSQWLNGVGPSTA